MGKTTPSPSLLSKKQLRDRRPYRPLENERISKGGISRISYRSSSISGEALMTKVEQLFKQYVALCEQNDPGACGDLVQHEDDETCKELYQLLLQDSRTKDKLVKPLWYNYNTQKMRWEP